MYNNVSLRAPGGRPAAHLRGTLLEKHLNHAIVDAGGLGYDVTMPISTFSAVPESGREVRLRIHKLTTTAAALATVSARRM